jgi:tripeptide aminopeptidase
MSDVLDLFCELARIDSESGEEATLIGHLRELFEEGLEADCVLDDYGNLIARVSAKGSTKETPILLCAHADTVKPGKGVEPVISDGVVRSSGETVLGADDKAGIAEIYEAVRSATKRPPVEIVITRGEETGLEGAKNLDRSKLRATMGFVLDGDELDEIVIGGPTYVAIDAEIIGKAAHAGMEPEKGISAIRVAAHAITHMPEGRIDEETTANVGIIEGGAIRNGVPERVLLKAECRSLDHDKCLRLAERMKSAIQDAAADAKAKANVTLTTMIRASRIEENAPVVQTARRALEFAGLSAKVRTIVGGTDASVLNEIGISTVVIGFGGKEPHATSEFIRIEDLEKATGIVRQLLHLLA